MDLYLRMGDELRALFKDLFHPKEKAAIEREIEKILATAAKIGGKLHKEAMLLQNDVKRFLQNPKDPKLIAVMKNHALKLEQETREI